MYFFTYDWTMILLIPAIIFTIYAERRVNHAYRKYRNVGTRRAITGRETARMMLDANGLYHVPIEMTPGELTDHYDPSADVMRLSSEVYNGTSLASVSIAAHETGHAIQDGTSYGMLKFRSAIAPVVSFVSTASWPLLIIGIIVAGAGQLTIGNLLFDIGLVFFLGVVLFHAVTLPVELNASRRAIQQLTALGIVEQDEVRGAKKVLSAAALTYFAALATAVLNLVRILLIRGRD